MRIEGPHQWLDLVVEWPSTEEEAGEHALAFSPSIFREHAREEDNFIELPREIGGIILRKGHVLEGYGNTGAHNGGEVKPVDVRFLED